MTGELPAYAEIWRPLLTLILSSLVVMGSPGPSTISVTAVGAVYGFRRSLSYMSGLVVGTIAVLLVVAAGFVAMLLSVPQLAPVLMAASAAYILYLAVRIATAPPLTKQHHGVAAPSFAGGFLLGIANPKAFVAIAAVFAGTNLVAEAPATDAALKTVTLSVMIVVIHVAWLLVGASLSRLLYDPVKSRIVNILLAVLLVLTTGIAFLG